MHTYWTTRLWFVAVSFLGLLVGHSPAGAETYSNVLTTGTKNWTDTSTWNPSTGYPVAGDTVNLNSMIWANSMTINAGAGWGASVINITGNQGNLHRLGIGSPGIVGTINYNHTAGNGFSWQVTTGDITLTITEWLESGTSLPNSHFPGTNSTWAFVGNAAIQYSTIPMNGGTVGALAGINNTTARLDFSGATTVELRRNPNTTLQQEFITTRTSNFGDPISIGRTDNGNQSWTVGAGSHPLLMPGGTSQDAGFRKVGNGNVSMPGVDLMLELSVVHPADDGDAISATGGLGGGLYAGEILANSLRVGTLVPTTANRAAAVLGLLRLDGQSRLQAGGAGSGRALDVEVDNYNLHFRIQAGSSSTAVGQIVAEPGAGAFYFGSTGTGKVKVNLNNDSRDLHTFVNTPLLIANDLVLGPGAYLHDRNDWQDLDANASGRLEFRHSLQAITTENTLWRTENTTFHAIGDNSLGNTLEVLSADYGVAGPGAANFLLDSLVLGRDAAGNLSESALLLADAYNNAPGGGREALYVNSLALFGGSTLYLGLTRATAINLYYQDGGAWVLAQPGAFGDGFIVVIPEPASLGLLAVGLLATLRRRNAGRRDTV